MIEITHKQAHYLIRESEDRRIPDEQWAALQAHLEGCPECRAYQQRMAGLKKDLHYQMQQRWAVAQVPEAGLAAKVTTFRKARDLRLRRALYAALGLLFFTVFIVWQWKTQVLSPAAKPTPVVVALPSLTPTPIGRFRGLIAYESRETGNGEIFLLNITGSAAPDGSNLTSNPAQDTDPAWAPDGEWIAFLSDRTGKREVYVVSVAGTRLTQLTADPDLDWQGPLSWSADGKWIALTGLRLSQNGDRWTYLVPLSGTAPRSLPGTRNVPGPAYFSPSQFLLATPKTVFDFFNRWSYEGWYGLRTLESSGSPGAAAGQEGAYDWVVGGSLAYIDELGDGIHGLPESQIRLSPVMGLINPETAGNPYTSRIIARTPNSTPFRSISYMPAGPFLATLRDERGIGCWTVHLFRAMYEDQPAPIEITGLCVERPLKRSAWTSGMTKNAGVWLVVVARPADPASGKPAGNTGLYALRILPASSGTSVATEFEHLADLPADNAEGPVADLPLAILPQAFLPQVRPTGDTVHIQPMAARPPEKALASAMPPLAVTESMLLAENDTVQGSGRDIVRLRADGAGIVMVPGGADNNCPTWSPDRQKIAYLSYKIVRASGIFVMDADGSNQKLVSASFIPGEMGGSFYGCPVWSPDSKVMAALWQDGRSSRLVVIDRETGVQGIFPIDSPSLLSSPVWSPDSKTIYLAERAVRTSPVYIVSISWSGLTGPRTERVLTEWDDVHAMAISPDGSQLALIADHAGTTTSIARTNMFLIDLARPGSYVFYMLPMYDPQLVKYPGRMEWLPDGQVLFAQPSSVMAHDKSTFVILDPNSGGMYNLASAEDALVDWAYRDGWLIYSSESGLWAQDTNRSSPISAPVRLSGRVVSSLDLK